MSMMIRAVAIFSTSVALLSCSRANPAFEADDASPTTGSLDGPDPLTTGQGSSSGDPDPSVGGSGDGTTSIDPTAPATSGTTAPGDGTTTDPITTGEPPTEACCEVHPTPQCEDDFVSQCVCQADPFCCDPAGTWDDHCVQGVDAFGCGDCGLDTSACCMPSAGPGCGVPTIDIGCVCEIGAEKGLQTPYASCCEGQWAAHCVIGAVALCGAACPPLPMVSCCVPGPQIGCGSVDVLACVCELDLTCCFESWSDPCAELAAGMCGAAC